MNALERIRMYVAEHRELSGRSFGHAQKGDDLALVLEVVEAAKVLAEKLPSVLEAVDKGPIALAHIHGCPYTGPQIEAELKSAQDALSALTKDD